MSWKIIHLTMLCNLPAVWLPVLRSHIHLSFPDAFHVRCDTFVPLYKQKCGSAKLPQTDEDSNQNLNTDLAAQHCYVCICMSHLFFAICKHIYQNAYYKLEYLPAHKNILIYKTIHFPFINRNPFFFIYG